jgi:hypothetical protein
MQFSCFALLDSFFAILKASDLVFMFCAPGLAFGDTEGVRSNFHVLRSQTRFRRYRGHMVYFSGFALPYSFSDVSRVMDPLFMFYAPGLIFGGIEGVRSSFHGLRSRTHFQLNRARHV